MKRIFLSALVVVALAGAEARAMDRELLTQYSTIPALLAGLYDGEWTCAEVLARGDLGLGTFDQLDGEMIVLDGRCYRAQSDGNVVPVAGSATTPFACVTFFDADLAVSNLTVGSVAELAATLDKQLPSANLVYALRLDGAFAYVKTRSVPRQTKPFRPLTEIVKTQPTFEWKNVRGTLLGFRFPIFAKELNVAGWHLHFITADRQHGGHVLDLRMTNQTAQLDLTPALQQNLSTNAAFLKLDLGGDSSEAVKKVEK
ncbi:MAG: acetolactate decarboxylase [Kiritimatiellaeota bacterium]|nr:acetolactate decarboxylase [Kiritimatiellota bacterium]